MRFDGTLWLGIGKDLASPHLFVWSDWLYFDDFGCSVRPSPKVRQLFGRVFNLLVKRPLLLNVNEVFGFFGLDCVKVDFAKSDQVFDIVEDFIGCSDLLRELALVDHPPPPEQGEHQDFPQKG